MVTFIDGAGNIVVSCIYYSWDKLLAAAVFWMEYSFFVILSVLLYPAETFCLIFILFQKEQAVQSQEES